jgi:hypothetical protein
MVEVPQKAKDIPQQVKDWGTIENVKLAVAFGIVFGAGIVAGWYLTISKILLI